MLLSMWVPRSLSTTMMLITMLLVEWDDVNFVDGYSLQRFCACFFYFPSRARFGPGKAHYGLSSAHGPNLCLFFFFLQQNLYTKTLPFFWFSVGKFQSSVAQQSLSFHSVSCITGYLSETHWRAELSLSLSQSPETAATKLGPERYCLNSLRVHHKMLSKMHTNCLVICLQETCWILFSFSLLLLSNLGTNAPAAYWLSILCFVLVKIFWLHFLLFFFW